MRTHVVCMLSLHPFYNQFQLTLYHTIPTFNDPETEGFENVVGKKMKMLVFSPFPTMFSTLPKPNLNISFTFILSSANAFNLDQSKILSFGIELNKQGNHDTV